jgi:hypothetical protein
MATIYTNSWDTVSCVVPGEYEPGDYVQLEVEFATRDGGRRKTRTLLVDAKVERTTRTEYDKSSWCEFTMKIHKNVRVP